MWLTITAEVMYNYNNKLSFKAVTKEHFHSL